MNQAGMTQAEMTAMAKGGVVGGTLATYLIFALAFTILLIIAEWKILTKAGEKGWKSLIPIYNTYIFFKIAKMNVGWFVAFLVSMVLAVVFASIASLQWLALIGIIIAIVVGIAFNLKLADAFGKGTGFKIGLILLPNIFTLILGFGSSEYQAD